MPEDWEVYARVLFGAGDAEVVSIHDPARGRARLALVEKGAVIAALFVDAEPVAIARTHVIATFEVAPAAGLLAGRAGEAEADPGPTVCACLGVGVTAIDAAIACGAAASVEDIGRLLGAETNCGSCRQELRALLKAATARIAAE
jgi:assimilatory nitrate reductase catalytic subunit